MVYIQQVIGKHFYSFWQYKNMSENSAIASEALQKYFLKKERKRFKWSVMALIK